MSAFAFRGIEAYRQTEARSRSPLELVVMLYDGLIRFTGEARDAIVRRALRRRQEAMSRSLAILAELQNTLNMDGGGEIAASLDRLYNYVRDRLVDASLKQDVQPLDDGVRVIKTLREAWGEIAAREAQPMAR